MELKSVLTAQLEIAEGIPSIPKHTIGQFRRFIGSNSNLLRADNIPHHVCAFFLPVHTASQSVYLVHHIKADDWIPPGGHIDPGETPLETVKREYQEELSYHIAAEPVRLVNLTVKHIRNHRHPCLTHYDFWYTVAMKDKISFTFDRGEFYSAAWFPLRDGLAKMSLPMYRKTVKESVASLFV